MNPADERDSPGVVVITAVRGRHDHLRRQRAGLARGTAAPDAHVVVTMNDPAAARLAAGLPGPPVHAAEAGLAGSGRLPVARARNLGAAASASITGGHPDDLLIFLDVDCIPGTELVEMYRQAASARPRSLLCGPVAYLPEVDLDAMDLDEAPDETFSELAEPHPARPAPEAGRLEESADFELFWSLSFAVRREVFDEIGGFDEGYTGYGAEDTDFAQRTRTAGLGLCWVGGASAYHQHHPVSDPPVEHLTDILTNGSRFAARWGFWPMGGWLEAFAERGLVHQSAEGWRRSVRVASVPASHVYIRHLAPPDGKDTPVRRLPDPPSRRADTPTGAPWWPPRMLDPEWIADADFDVFHIHFGFDAESVAHLEEVCDALDAKGTPLVFTVHDLQNPHHEDAALHQAQLDVLIRRAAAVLTLSRRAAQTIESQWGVRPQVLPHPHVVELELIEDYGRLPRRRDDEFRLGVHLKSLRQNMRPLQVLQAAAWVTGQVHGAVLQVNVHRDVYERDGARHNPALRSWLDSDDVDVDLRVHDYFSDSELWDYLGGLHASLLPYRYGTHSGWLEACHDLGTIVIAPDVGCYASQGADHMYQWEGETVDRRSLLQAVESAVRQTAPSGAACAAERARQQRRWRTEQRTHVAAEHERLYRSLLE